MPSFPVDLILNSYLFRAELNKFRRSNCRTGGRIFMTPSNIRYFGVYYAFSVKFWPTPTPTDAEKRRPRLRSNGIECKVETINVLSRSSIRIASVFLGPGPIYNASRRRTIKRLVGGGADDDRR
ncbi:hypothetical protein GWI33_008547 [Rhynchophorus ferrugineus]|uniref:Uncharacterized protein n=1 Tax=Rhynchophorus ferrugineus TaxID=354439 RepID=A0A834IFZ8_RHYFE|nr:hypothetical protein GWI33_008547 [Rhynchophorus ferrugineus]